VSASQSGGWRVQAVCENSAAGDGGAGGLGRCGGGEGGGDVGLGVKGVCC
jgi:hypothetical protein